LRGRDVLATYSPNAVLIRETEVGFRIDRMMAWKTFRGVDMVGVQTEGGKVFVLDAFRLEVPGAPVLKAKQSVVGMKVGRGLPGRCNRFAVLRCGRRCHRR
jgi:hypothetical protein